MNKFFVSALFILFGWNNASAAEVQLSCASGACEAAKVSRKEGLWPRDYYQEIGKDQWKLFNGWKMNAVWKGDKPKGVDPDMYLRIKPAAGSPPACFVQAFNQTTKLCVKQSIFVVGFDGRTVMVNPQLPVWYFEGGFNNNPSGSKDENGNSNEGSAVNQTCYAGGPPDPMYRDSIEKLGSLNCSAEVQAIAYDTEKGVIGTSSPVSINLTVLPRPLKAPDDASRTVKVDFRYNFPSNYKTCEENGPVKDQNGNIKKDADGNDIVDRTCKTAAVSYFEHYKAAFCDKSTGSNLVPNLLGSSFPIVNQGIKACTAESGAIVDHVEMQVSKTGSNDIYILNPIPSPPYAENNKVTSNYFLATIEDKKSGMKSSPSSSPDFKITVPENVDHIVLDVSYDTLMKPEAKDVDYGTLSSGVSTKQRYQYGTFQAYLKPSDMGSMITAFYTYFAVGNISNPGIPGIPADQDFLNFGYTWHEIDYEFTPGPHPQINPPAYLNDGTFDPYTSMADLGKSVSLNLISEGNADLQQTGAPQHHYYCPNPDNKQCFKNAKNLVFPSKGGKLYPYDDYHLYTLVWDRDSLRFYFEINGRQELAYTIPFIKKDILSGASEGVLNSHMHAQDRFNEAMVIDKDNKIHPTSPQFILLNLWQFTPAGKFTGEFTGDFKNPDQTYNAYFKMVRWSPCVAKDGEFSTSCSATERLGKVYNVDGVLADAAMQQAYQWCFGANNEYVACQKQPQGVKTVTYANKNEFLKDPSGWMYIPQVGWSQNTSVMVQNNVNINPKQGLDVCLTDQWNHRAYWDKDGYHPALGCDKQPLLRVPSDSNNVHTALLVVHSKFANDSITMLYAKKLEKDLVNQPWVDARPQFPDEINANVQQAISPFNNTWGFADKNGDGCQQSDQAGDTSRKVGHRCAGSGIYGDSRVRLRGDYYANDIFLPVPTYYTVNVNGQSQKKAMVLPSGFKDHILFKGKESSWDKELICRISYEDAGKNVEPIVKGQPFVFRDGGSYELNGIVKCTTSDNTGIKWVGNSPAVMPLPDNTADITWSMATVVDKPEFDNRIRYEVRVAGQPVCEGLAMGANNNSCHADLSNIKYDRTTNQQIAVTASIDTPETGALANVIYFDLISQNAAAYLDWSGANVFAEMNKDQTTLSVSWDKGATVVNPPEKPDSLIYFVSVDGKQVRVVNDPEQGAKDIDISALTKGQHVVSVEVHYGPYPVRGGAIKTKLFVKGEVPNEASVDWKNANVTAVLNDDQSTVTVEWTPAKLLNAKNGETFTYRVIAGKDVKNVAGSVTSEKFDVSKLDAGVYPVSVEVVPSTKIPVNGENPKTVTFEIKVKESASVDWKNANVTAVLNDDRSTVTVEWTPAKLLNAKNGETFTYRVIAGKDVKNVAGNVTSEKFDVSKLDAGVYPVSVEVVPSTKIPVNGENPKATTFKIEALAASVLWPAGEVTVDVSKDNKVAVVKWPAASIVNGNAGDKVEYVLQYKNKLKDESFVTTNTNLQLDVAALETGNYTVTVDVKTNLTVNGQRARTATFAIERKQPIAANVIVDACRIPGNPKRIVVQFRDPVPTSESLVVQYKGQNAGVVTGAGSNKINFIAPNNDISADASVLVRFSSVDQDSNLVNIRYRGMCSQ